MTTTDVDLYLDKNGNVVEAGPKAAFLLVRAGKQIPKGYTPPSKPAEEPEPVVEVKEVPKAANKARKKPANKGARK